MPRARLSKEMREVTSPANFFSTFNPNLDYIRTGFRVLDCVLGGGWCLGRLSNIVGDKSTGKSLLAIEAAANFIRDYPGGKVFYRESEAAFDKHYAEALGMPIDKVDFGRVFTVQDLYEDLNKSLDFLGKSNQPGLYITDSLDAIPDASELDTPFGEGGYKLQKQKHMGELFRKKIQHIEESRLSWLVISQVRDKIGVTFGKQQTRSGGKALDFYASHVLWLSHIKVMKRQVNKLERAYGVQIRAKCEKNKIGNPFRDCDFNILFGFGIDNLAGCVDWLSDVGYEKEITNGSTPAAYIKAVEKMGDQEYREELERLGNAVVKVWSKVETSFLPTRKKY